MIGIPEITMIVIVAVMFFFGKDKLLGWAKSIGEAKKTYTAASKEVKIDEQ